MVTPLSQPSVLSSIAPLKIPPKEAVLKEFSKITLALKHTLFCQLSYGKLLLRLPVSQGKVRKYKSTTQIVPHVILTDWHSHLWPSRYWASATHCLQQTTQTSTYSPFRPISFWTWSPPSSLGSAGWSSAFRRVLKMFYQVFFFSKYMTRPM